MIVRKTPLAFTLCVLLTAAPQALASFDEPDCSWSDEFCLLKGVPALTPDNDSRDNLLRLLSEARAFALPVQAMPADITRSRDFYFAWHPEWLNGRPSTAPEEAGPQDVPLSAQLAALNIDPMQLAPSAENGDYLGPADYSQENRFVSNTPRAVSAYIAALQADETLSAPQRQTLARARLALFYGTPADRLQESLSAFPTGSTALLFSTYLSGIVHFYNGDYDAASQDFTLLLESRQPWLTETAQYMLMRTALNRSSQHSVGRYGEFDLNRVSQEAARQAQEEAQRYLQRWPEGRYADSARGMLRRISWYQQAWPQLATLYEQALSQAADARTLRERIIEYDNVFGMQFFNDPPRSTFANAPLVSYVELLRALRLNGGSQPTLTQAQLDASRAVFEKSGRLPLWHNLQLNLWMATNNPAAVLQAVTPAQTLPARDILAFSEQVLYGEALMAQEQWPAARDFWQRLLKLSQDDEQRQYIQAKLTATLLSSGDVAAIFAPDSAITNLRFRSRALKKAASPALLRQQARRGPNDEERTIALHTLLIHDLLEGRFSDWSTDRKLAAAVTAPLSDEAFADVSLEVFDWRGDAAEAGYFCRSLDETVLALSKNADDAHALNCLGEFFRTTRANIDLWADGAGNDALEATSPRPPSYGQFDRQSYYQHIITSPKAEPEDKSYALYRAVMCYAPGGYNECGGEAVDKLMRKGWYTQLKTQYPGSQWAQQLKYYW
jgi:hypothetical protein